MKGDAFGTYEEGVGFLLREPNGDDPGWRLLEGWFWSLASPAERWDALRSFAQLRLDDSTLMTVGVFMLEPFIEEQGLGSEVELQLGALDPAFQTMIDAVLVSEPLRGMVAGVRSADA